MRRDGQTDRQTVPALFARRRWRRGEDGSERVKPSIILTSEPSGSRFLPVVGRESRSQVVESEDGNMLDDT